LGTAGDQDLREREEDKEEVMNLRVVLYCLLGGLALLLPGMTVGHLFWWYVSGVVLTAAFVPVALYGPRTALGQLGVIFPVLFVVSVLTTWSEALLFVKTPAIQAHPFRDLAAETLVYLIVAIVLVVLGRVLGLTGDSTKPMPRRPVGKALGTVAICAVAYMIYYLVFGGITYQFFTKQYFPNAAELIAPLGWWFWAIQIARGLLMTLAVMPAIYTLRLSRGTVAICAGLLIWVAGGLAPLLVPNEFMGTRQRFIHIVEIFTQNFTLGLTAGLLLRPGNGIENVDSSLKSKACSHVL
jgi:hypothetical protein